MRAYFAVLWMLSSPLVFAAPENDLCAGAEIVPGGGPFPLLTSVVDVASATTTGDPSPPSCQPNVSRSVWFRFTPTVTTEYTFSSCPEEGTATTLEDTVLAVYTSSDGTCGGSFQQLPGGCDDDSCALTSLRSAIREIPLEAGTTYHLLAYQYSTGSPPPNASAVQIRVSQTPPPPPPPANDLCAGAEEIPGGGGFPVLSSVVADITGATAAGDPPAPTCQPNGTRSLWFTFMPPETGGYAISTCADAPTATTVDDTIVSVYTSATGTCSGPFAQVAGGCDDNACGIEAAQASIANLSLAAGTRYYVLVEKFGSARPSGGSTAVQLQVDRTNPPPPNDACDAAVLVPSSGPFPWLSPVEQDVRTAGSEGDPPIPPPCQASVSRSIWYRFVPSLDGTYSFSLCADAPTGTTTDDTVLSLWRSSDGTCSGTWTAVAGACDDDSCGVEAAQSVLPSIGLAAGSAYFALVHQYGSLPPAAGDAAVQLRVDLVGPPVDSDSDGTLDGEDCAPGDPGAWSAPGPARHLRFGSTKSALLWDAPFPPGDADRTYDLLRSPVASDFFVPTCIVQDASATAASDPAIPAGMFAYLVRVRNGCDTNTGTMSDGILRVPGDCP